MDIKLDHGQTALHAACMFGSASVADYLLRNGAQPAIADDEGDNALHCAVHK